MTVGNNFRQKIHQALSSVRSLFPFFLPERPTHPHEREGDGKRNIKLGWPYDNYEWVSAKASTFFPKKKIAPSTFLDLTMHFISC